MGVFKRKDSNNWWYRFEWGGIAIAKSTKQTNKRVAEQMESAHRTSLAKGEVGIRDRLKVPTLSEFTEKHFRPFLREKHAQKPRTLSYYEDGIRALLAVPSLANAPMDAIGQEQITGLTASLRTPDLRDLNLRPI